jgi:hypothetical protein
VVRGRCLRERRYDDRCGARRSTKLSQRKRTGGRIEGSHRQLAVPSSCCQRARGPRSVRRRDTRATRSSAFAPMRPDFVAAFRRPCGICGRGKPCLPSESNRIDPCKHAQPDTSRARLSAVGEAIDPHTPIGCRESIWPHEALPEQTLKGGVGILLRPAVTRGRLLNAAQKRTRASA